MSKRVALAVAVPVAAVIVGFAGAGTASALVPTCDCAPVYSESAAPLAPDDAAALAAVPGTTGMSDAVAVDPATALAAAAAPDADTYFDPDLTPDEAVGIEPDAGTTASDSVEDAARAAATRVLCWSNSAWEQWGTWPYEQRVTNTAYWCAQVGVKITMRTSSVTGSGTLCGINWRTSQPLAGGVGFPYFTMRSSAGFACPTVIPWVVLHPTHHIDVRRDDRSVTSFVGSG